MFSVESKGMMEIFIEFPFIFELKIDIDNVLHTFFKARLFIFSSIPQRLNVDIILSFMFLAIQTRILYFSSIFISPITFS